MGSLFVALALVFATVAVQVYRAVGDFVDAARWVTHTVEVQREIELSVATLRAMEASLRAHMLSSDPGRLVDYYAELPKLQGHGARLTVLVQDSPSQAVAANALNEAIGKRLRSMVVTQGLFAANGLDAVLASAQIEQSNHEDRAIDEIAQSMVKVEDTLLSSREQRTAELAQVTQVLTFAAVVVCVLILTIALLLLFHEQRRRQDSEARMRSSNEDLATSLDVSQRLGHTLRQLSELGEMLQGCRSIDEAVSGLCASLPALLPDHSGSLSLINASQNLVEALTSWGEPPVGSEPLFAPDDCWALRRGQAYPLTGITPAFTCKHLHRSHDPMICETHLCIPLIAQGEMLGILTFSAEHAIDDRSRAVALAAGEQVSLAIANLMLQETLRTQSLRDPLTGLFNRRYLEASLEREMQRATRRQQPMSVLMLDIDHFKRFNDSHGHDAGDALLAQFGALLGRVVRSEDVACRYGGEEFTIVLHETDAKQAMVRAEEICKAVRSLDVQHRRQTLGPITISIGIATFPQNGTSPDELLRSADRALYATKHAGRDHARMAA